MKRLALLIVFLLTVALLCGCYSGTVDSQKIENAETDNFMFYVVSEENYGQVIVNKKTNVMYWRSRGSYSYGILTLLVNPDGTPMIWE